MPHGSNIIKLFADDCARKISNTCQEIPSGAFSKNLGSNFDTSGNSASTMPHNDHERKAMEGIEKRLYCYPAIAEVTAFRYQISNGKTKFGAAVLLYDWIESVTTADIKNWLAKSFDSDCLPVKIVWLDTGSFEA